MELSIPGTCELPGLGSAERFSQAIPRVTVIVCTRDRPAELENCLAALEKENYPSFRVLVVDNATGTKARDICRPREITCIHAPGPGVGRAMNVGARAARGDVIAFIDDDAVPEPGWLDALVRDFADPTVAAVTGRIRFMKAQDDSRAMSTEEAPDGQICRPRGSFDKGTRDWFSVACFGGIGDGSNMAFRRNLFTELMAFDERLGRGRVLEGGVEHVAFMSVIARGYRVTHVPDAVVRHPFPATPALWRTRRARQLRTSIAYVMFLWVEFPKNRADLLRFLYRAVLKRILRMATGAPRPVHLSRWRALTAMAGGPLLYWKARREWTAATGNVEALQTSAPDWPKKKPEQVGR